MSDDVDQIPDHAVKFRTKNHGVKLLRESDRTHHNNCRRQSRRRYKTLLKNAQEELKAEQRKVEIDHSKKIESDDDEPNEKEIDLENQTVLSFGENDTGFSMNMSNVSTLDTNEFNEMNDNESSIAASSIITQPEKGEELQSKKSSSKNNSTKLSNEKISEIICSKLTLKDVVYMKNVSESIYTTEDFMSQSQLDQLNDEIIEDEVEEKKENSDIVPQLRLAEDGSFVVDEESITIQETNKHINREKIIISESKIGLIERRKQNIRRRQWTEFETVRFYKALSLIGSDFTLMQRLLPTRSRNEIQKKFKREEKINPRAIDEALYSNKEDENNDFDFSFFFEQQPEKTKKKSTKTKESGTVSSIDGSGIRRRKRKIDEDVKRRREEQKELKKKGYFDEGVIEKAMELETINNL
ncbi:hypothetical protein SNEBB_003606 [Seison nebaliae]|nr:hypothetical protein SNEBB_003606 [Seison nebaliae]